MLKELIEIETRFGGASVDEVRKSANALLRRQFLFAGDRGSTHAYEILTSPRFRIYFDSLFDALGYDLRINEAEQWVGILPDVDLEWFPRMRIEPTIVLLVLALTWQEEVNKGGAEARAVVTTTLNALFERYRDVTARGRKEAITTGRFEESLREFARRGLVNIGPLDPDEADKQIDIRPMVHMLVDGNVLARLESFATDAETVSARHGNQSDNDPDIAVADEEEEVPA